jgi:hypothetical protein
MPWLYIIKRSAFLLRIQLIFHFPYGMGTVHNPSTSKRQNHHTISSQHSTIQFQPSSTSKKAHIHTLLNENAKKNTSITTSKNDIYPKTSIMKKYSIFLPSARPLAVMLSHRSASCLPMTGGPQKKMPTLMVSVSSSAAAAGPSYGFSESGDASWGWWWWSPPSD